MRVPVTLGRRPDEPPDAELAGWFGDRLLGAIGRRDAAGGLGAGRRRGLARQPLVRAAGGVDAGRAADGRHLVVVNLSDERADGMVRWPAVPAGPLTLVDLLDGETFERDGTAIAADGLYVALDGWAATILRT